MTTPSTTEVLYQRLSDRAPQIDIDPQQGCIHFIAWEVGESAISKYDDHGKALLKEIHLQLPAAVLGIFVSAHPGVVIPNPILPSGFNGALAQIRFQTLRNLVGFKEGTPLCSLFLMPSMMGGVRVREVESDSLKERIPQGLPMELICASRTFTASRHEHIMADLKARREQQVADEKRAIREEVRQKIKHVPIEGRQIPEEIIEKYIDFIIQRGDHEDRHYYHSYKILEFLTESELDEYLTTIKDTGGYTLYRKYKEAWAGLYYGFLTEANIKNPFD
jgi:hypothetical protein